MVARSLSEQWDQCKEALREALDPDEAMAWLPGLRLAHLSRERAVLVGVPNAFFHKRILRQFSPLLRRMLAGAFADWGLAEDLRLELRIGPENAAREGVGNDGAPGWEPEGRGAHGPPSSAGLVREAGGQLPLFPGDEEAIEAAPPMAVPGGAPSFATFQISAANRIVFDLAREVAATPGRYNPFFLVSASGLGKSHLLGAIATEIAARHPDWRIVRRSAEQFTVDLLEGIRARRMPAVRETYRGADVLLLDDLGFLEVSPKAQEELLHTFEALHGAGRQMVFAADRVPTTLLGLAETLRSRLEQSLIAELKPPERETRLAILRAAAARAAIPIEEPELAFLAERISSGPRRLEGALVRICTYASMLKAPIDAAFVREMAAPWLDPEPTANGHVPPAAVLAAVCAEFALTQRQLQSRDRSRQRDLARQMAMRLLREASGLSHGEIGRLIGNRAQSTVVEAVAALQRKLDMQPAAAATWSRLWHRLAETSRRP